MNVWLKIRRLEQLRSKHERSPLWRKSWWDWAIAGIILLAWAPVILFYLQH